MRNVAILNRPEVYLQIMRYEMTQSLCKRDAKSESHPGMKLAPVRVFSCKHPLDFHYISQAETSRDLEISCRKREMSRENDL